MKSVDAMLRNRAIKDAFITLKLNLKRGGLHQTYSIVIVAENSWIRECNTPKVNKKEED